MVSTPFIYWGAYSNVTYAGTSALGAGCGQLQSIDLTRCSIVTYAGTSALGAGYVKLQITNRRSRYLPSGDERW